MNNPSSRHENHCFDENQKITLFNFPVIKMANSHILLADLKLYNYPVQLSAATSTEEAMLLMELQKEIKLMQLIQEPWASDMVEDTPAAAEARVVDDVVPE
ncbi:hypothetical protein YC2023_051496 [Brassica napus]